MVDILKLEGNVVTSSMHDKIWLFYGPPGTYKTTVATGDTAHTLLAAYEIGYKFIPGVRAANLTNWHGLKDLIRQLDSVEARKQYKTIVIDTIGLAYKACIAYICAKEGVTEIGKIPYGQGYSMAKNEFEKTMNMIPQLGYGLVMIAHSDELIDEKNGVSVKVDIDKRPSSVIKGMSDFILYARKEQKDGSDGMSVFAYSETSNPNIEVKSRARFFPKRIEFTYENILAALDEAIKEQDKFFNTKSVEKPNFDMYKESEVDIEAIKKEVISLATELFKTPLSEKTQIAIQEEMHGVRIGEATNAQVASLYSLRDKLIDLKKTL
jgi:DNA polymerase III delta prime subunit